MGILNLSPVPEPKAIVPVTQPRWAMKARPAVIDHGGPAVPTTVRQRGQTRSFVSGLEAVRQGLAQGERLLLVTGDSGTGKTMLCRALIEESEPLTQTSVMLQPPATPEDLLAQFLRDVGVLDNGTSAMLMTRNSLIFALQRYLESLIPIGGRAVLVIDEAQHLTPAVLEQLRLILNFETGEAALLQVVLVGQPELDALLRWPELRRVAQRVSRRCELGGIESDEFPTFIEECLDRRSPGGLVRFTPAAERMLVSLSNGVPRVTEQLCGHALDLAASQNAYRIEPAVVQGAAKRLGLNVAVSRGSRNRIVAGIGAVAACAVVAGGVWGWASRGVSASASHQQIAVAATATAGSAPAATAPAAPAESGLGSKALETAGGLTVTVSTFRTESRARAVVAQLVDEGFPAFARSKSENGPYQVIVGPYVSAEEAVAAQKSLAAKGAAGTEVRIETADLSRPGWR